MNAIREATSTLDNWRTLFHSGVELVSAVRECIENGANQPEEYADALHGAYDYLSRLNDELDAFIAGLYKKGMETDGNE